MQVREMHELNARDLWHNIKYMFENEKKIIFFCCLVVAAARSFMIYYECGKRRVIYCKTKLGRPELNAIERVQEQLAFSCGSQLFPAGPYTDKLVCREGQNCKTPIEVAYYSGIL